MEMNMEILGLLIMIGGLLIPALQMFCWPLFGGWLPLTTEVLFSRILPYEFYIWLQDESTLKQIISYIAEDMSLFVFLETIGMIMVFLGWILETSTNKAAEKYSRLKSDTPYQQSLSKKIPIPLILLITVSACLFLTKSVNINEHFIEIAMANKPLPAMTPITNEHISVEKVFIDKLPKGRSVNPTSVIGRVLAVSVYEGQILTESCLAPYGSAQHLIAQMPHGMRAFSVYVANRSMPDRALLKPGCIVDVLVSYRLSSSDSDEGEALSTTMFRGIQVLAVSGEWIKELELSMTHAYRKKVEEEEKANTKSKKSGESKVTLLVDTSQAEALQLAQNNGDILLTIRNPNDKKEFDEDPSILNRRKLTPRFDDKWTKSGNKYDDSRNPFREITVIHGRKVQTANSK